MHVHWFDNISEYSYTSATSWYRNMCTWEIRRNCPIAKELYIEIDDCVILIVCHSTYCTCGSGLLTPFEELYFSVHGGIYR